MTRALLAIALLTSGCAAATAPARVVAPIAGDPSPTNGCASPVSTWSVPMRPVAQRALAAVITHGEPVELRVHDLLTNRSLWQRPVRSTVRPMILDDVIVTVEDAALVAYDLATGTERLRGALPAGYFVGAAQVGRLLAFVVNAPTWDPATRHSTLGAWDLDSGTLRYVRRVPEVLGRPHAAGTQIWALSDHRDLRAFDAASGDDLACTALADAAVVDGLHLEDAALWFGTKEPRRLNAAPETPSLAPPRVGAPAGLEVLASDYGSVPATRSAHGRVGWSTHATPPGPFYFVFYRHLIAYASDGQVRWAKVFPRDILRSRATPTALWLLLEDGTWLALNDADGGMLATGSVGRDLASAEFAVHHAHLDKPDGPPSPLAAHPALAAMAVDPDTRLLTSRRLAVDALAKIEGDSATRDLLAVARAASTPDALRAHVVTRLTERTSGIDPLLQALDERYDFLQGTSAPPLRVLVPPLVARNEARALPALQRHLMDPATPLADLALCVQAIASIGGTAAHAALARFAAMYRHDTALSQDGRALTLARSILAPATPATPATHAETAVAKVDAQPASTFPPTTMRTAVPRPKPAPFWALSEARTPKPWFIPQGDPWWKSQNDLFISIEMPAPPVTVPAPPPSASESTPPAPTDAWWTPVSP